MITGRIHIRSTLVSARAIRAISQAHEQGDHDECYEIGGGLSVHDGAAPESFVVELSAHLPPCRHRRSPRKANGPAGEGVVQARFRSGPDQPQRSVAILQRRRVRRSGGWPGNPWSPVARLDDAHCGAGRRSPDPSPACDERGMGHVAGVGRRISRRCSRRGRGRSEAAAPPELRLRPSWSVRRSARHQREPRDRHQQCVFMPDETSPRRGLQGSRPQHEHGNTPLFMLQIR